MSFIIWQLRARPAPALRTSPCSNSPSPPIAARERSEATTVQRINTRGVALEGACGAIGATTAVACSADYAFLKP